MSLEKAADPVTTPAPKEAPEVDRSADEAWVESMRERLDLECRRWPGSRALPPLSKRFAEYESCGAIPWTKGRR